MTVVACAAVAGIGYPVQAWVHGRQTEAAKRLLGAEQVTVFDTGLIGLLPQIDRPDLSISFEDLPKPDRHAAWQSLVSALDVYPAGFLHRVVDRIILAGNIHFWSGQEVGGFYFERGFAVNCRGMEDTYIVRAVHHELSSLVRLAATPPEADWMGASPPGFTYLSYDAARAMIRDGSGDATGPEQYERGFVRAYGTTTLDNDFNTYAERMFADGPAFATIIKNYPRMQAKTRLVIASYLKVSAKMQSYFDRTGLAAAAQ